MTLDSRLFGRAVMSSTRARLAAGFGSLLLGLLAAGVFGIIALRGLSKEVEAAMKRVQVTVELGTDLQRNVLELIFAAEGYLASGDREDKKRFVELAGRTQELAARYRDQATLLTDKAQLVTRLSEDLTELEVEYARAHALYETGERERAKAVADAAHPLAERVTTVISVLGERETRVVATQTTQLEAQARSRSIYLIVILGLTLVLGLALAIVTARSLDRPLRELLAAAGGLGRGDLRARVPTKGMPAEFAEVGTAFNTMAGELSDLASQVISTASQLSASAADFSIMSEQFSSSAQEVAAAVSEISEGADAQAEALDKVSTAVGELRDDASLIESEANRNRELTHGITRDAGVSRESLRDAMERFLSLRDTVHDTASEIEGLAGASHQITGFVKRINSIAEQTSLLSLNAAIEAAHAGHVGRGFSVVAEEVRKLAAQADAGAEEVQLVVSDLATRIASAVEKMRDSESGMNQAESVARISEDAFAAIAEGLERIAIANDQATATVKRSLALLGEVAANIETAAQTATAHASRSQDVSAAVQEQSATTEQITSSAAELVAVADGLRELVSKWRV